jgi:N6-L-threonylcarbamoyladenine synthase
MLILGIETSCDETSAAILRDGTEVLANIVASSKDFHEKTGGIVPEVASRKQLEFIVPVINEAMRSANVTKDNIDAIAVTVGPGLVGSLLIGVAAAKTLALAWSKPLVPVNHLIGHIYGNFINNSSSIEFPALVLLVSGGHTDLVLMRTHGNFEYLGGTLDDAAGEAFDKTARLLGLSKYLGGVKLSQTAATCTENLLKNKLPRPLLKEENYDFSFSGLKTAVRRLVETNDNKLPVDCVAREFEDAVVDVLVTKTVKAALANKVSSVLLAGGVSANSVLRERMSLALKNTSIKLFFPEFGLCTDNAAYIASAAYFNYKEKPLSDVVADPSLSIMD